jgi:hypothetical protein
MSVFRFRLYSAAPSLCRTLTTTPAVDRWYKDHAANRLFWRYGYEDKVSAFA